MFYSDLFSKLFVGPLGLQWFQISFVADVAPMSTLRYLGVICKVGFEGSLPPTDKILYIVGCEAVYNFASRLLVNQELTHWLCLLEAAVLKTYSLSMHLFFLGRLKCHLTIPSCLWCFFVFPQIYLNLFVQRNVVSFKIITPSESMFMSYKLVFLKLFYFSVLHLIM